MYRLFRTPHIVASALLLAFVVIPQFLPTASPLALGVAHAQGTQIQEGTGKIRSGLIPCGNSLDPKEQCDFQDLLMLGRNLTNYLIMISIPLAAISFAWAGFLYLSSAGNQGKVDDAKKIFWRVFMGFLFVVSAWLIVYAITSLLNPEFSLLTPN